MVTEETARGRGTGPTFVVIDNTENDAQRREGDQDSRETVGGFVVTESPKRREEVSQADASDSTIGVEQPLPRVRRCSVCGEMGHTARTCESQGSTDVGTRAPRKPSKDAVGALAPMVVSTLNFCAVSTFGADCGLSGLESNLLVPSLQRTLERMPAAAATRAAVIIDPLVILTVMIMWGKRIASIKAAEAKEQYLIQPFEAARAAGVSGTTYSAETPQQETNNTRVPEAAQVNGHYGAPSIVREAFNESV